MLAAYVVSQHRSPSEIQTSNGAVTHTRQEETASRCFVLFSQPKSHSKIRQQQQFSFSL